MFQCVFVATPMHNISKKTTFFKKLYRCYRYVCTESFEYMTSTSASWEYSTKIMKIIL